MTLTLEEMIAKVEALKGSETAQVEDVSAVLEQLKVFQANGMPTPEPTPTPVPPVDASKMVAKINLVNEASEVVAVFVPEKVEAPVESAPVSEEEPVA